MRDLVGFQCQSESALHSLLGQKYHEVSGSRDDHNYVQRANSISQQIPHITWRVWITVFYPCALKPSVSFWIHVGSYHLCNQLPLCVAICSTLFNYTHNHIPTYMLHEMCLCVFLKLVCFKYKMCVGNSYPSLLIAFGIQTACPSSKFGIPNRAPPQVVRAVNGIRANVLFGLGNDGGRIENTHFPGKEICIPWISIWI